MSVKVCSNKTNIKEVEVSLSLSFFQSDVRTRKKNFDGKEEEEKTRVRKLQSCLDLCAETKSWILFVIYLRFGALREGDEEAILLKKFWSLKD